VSRARLVLAIGKHRITGGIANRNAKGAPFRAERLEIMLDRTREEQVSGRFGIIISFGKHFELEKVGPGRFTKFEKVKIVKGKEREAAEPTIVATFTPRERDITPMGIANEIRSGRVDVGTLDTAALHI